MRIKRVGTRARADLNSRYPNDRDVTCGPNSGTALSESGRAKTAQRPAPVHSGGGRGGVVAGDLLVVGRQVLGHLEGDNVALGQVRPQRFRQVRLRRARPPAVGVRGGAAARWRVRLRSGTGQGGRAARAA